MIPEIEQLMRQGHEVLIVPPCSPKGGSSTAPNFVRTREKPSILRLF